MAHAISRQGTTPAGGVVGALRDQATPRWLLYYYLVQMASQLALLSDSLAGARVLLRSSAFSMSLIALAMTAGRRAGPRQPATSFAVFLLLIIGLESFHPDTTGGLGAVATLAMYTAIVGPIFWVPRLALDISWFRRVVLILWAFHSLSALVGALQVYFPGFFQPAISTVLSNDYVSSLHITLASGESILRPTGLTDTPGGAAVGATYATLLALGLWSDQRKIWFRALLVASVAVGIFTLYLCQVRSLVVMVAIAIVAMASAHAVSGRIRNFAGIGLGVGLTAIASFVAAVSVGGDEVVRRLSTLTESAPTEVYYANRGIFLEHTVSTLVPQYPLGAGLGRWGMIANYFGGGPSTFIWAEIQWTGWLLDGGILLMVVYAAMLAMTLRSIWRLAKDRPSQNTPDVANWAAMLVGYDVGTIALTFNFPVFMSNFGLDFWLLNAALWAAAHQHKASRRMAFASKS